MGLASPSIFRDVDTTVHFGSSASTRDKGKLIVRSARKGQGSKVIDGFGKPAYRTGMSDSSLTSLSHYSPSGLIR